jgi:predicted DNA-binding transcriptional regulator AlpA
MKASAIVPIPDLVGSLDMSPEELAGFTEIAEILGVHKRTVQRYIARDDFPEPIGRLARGRVWRREDIEKWGADRPKPGRPRKEPS